MRQRMQESYFLFLPRPALFPLFFLSMEMLRLPLTILATLLILMSFVAQLFELAPELQLRTLRLRSRRLDLEWLLPCDDGRRRLGLSRRI